MSILQNGERVRLLGINTPEKGQPYYEEATNRLKELIEGKTIALEKDIEDKDQYGRLLRHIYIDDTFVNLEMVREGYANVYVIHPNVKYSSKFEKAEEEAKAELKAEGKPEQIWDRILPGKMERFISDNTTLDQEQCLLDQDFIKDAKQNVADYVKSYGDVKVVNFKRVSLG